MLKKIIFIVLSLSFIGAISFAHSGRTNSSGCHNDNISGGYHCHKGYEVKEKTASSKKVKIKKTVNKK